MVDGATGDQIYRVQYNLQDDGGTASTSGWHSMRSWSVETPHVGIDGVEKKTKEGIHPRLYFKYVKSKMKMVERMKFKERLSKLEELSEKYSKLGQEALSDECIRQYYTIARESAMWACGYNMFVTEDILNKFRYQIKGDLKITPIKNFARIIPEKPAAKIKSAMERKLFDSYVIVHLDIKQQSVLETKKERVEREKDPICFGRIDDCDKYYFVCDWEDEFDDLRFQDIVKKLSLSKKDLKLNKTYELPDVLPKKEEK